MGEPPDGRPGHAEGWSPDEHLAGFECLRLPLAADPLPEEDGAPLVGTLIRRSDPALRAHARAILHVHGWNDYFFHGHVAEFYEAQGIAFYALDLRRYGRSWVEPQLRGFITDLSDYTEELAAALSVIGAGHPVVLLGGHSTGGLVVTLYASDHPGTLAGLVLNSPWLDMWVTPALTSVLRPVLSQWSRRNPTLPLPLPDSDETPFYAQAMHSAYGGEWNYSLDLKLERADHPRVGWLRAVIQGHRRVARGLNLDCPVLVTTSTKDAWLRPSLESARESDIVLDVDRIAAVSWRLGNVVALARIEGGTHDLSLSPSPARERFFEAVTAWLRGYVPAP
ncbi:MAG: alpha/beta hydrolase [Propioniciclava sp.]|uniref:alpha/beta hydrolase n=1 Tax=Propioniciclava sp. TaxID=2038686 RepID=UPI0039E4BFF0